MIQKTWTTKRASGRNEAQTHVRRTLQNCKAVIEKLETIVVQICGKSGQSAIGRRDALFKALRKKSKDGDLQQCRDQFAWYQRILQELLSLINIQNSREYGAANARSFDIVIRAIQDIGQQLGSQIATLQNPSRPSGAEQNRMHDLKQLELAVTNTTGGLSARFGNKHFDIPQPVSGIFTGRSVNLQELNEILVYHPQENGLSCQRRFIIYGVGGSGKTQFCSKFAELNRESFWGIFWIDASTEERVVQTYSSIAKIAGVEPNANAAMHWLSNLDTTWLLIIDNADDPEMDIEKYFPKGNRGRILVTTRNPEHKIHGNVEPRFYKIQGLEKQEAIDLLLTAEEPIPWDTSSVDRALKITEKLGFLALAIVQAGAVIRDGLCTLENYNSFFERSWTSLRAWAERKPAGDDKNHHLMYIYTTWEICYQRMESKASQGSKSASDAVQLLNTFSYLHWENIHFEILQRAIENPVTETKQQEKET
jgi:hypothetical protein